nr:hypothetical protein [Tanacetum cinerariifolium]
MHYGQLQEILDFSYLFSKLCCSELSDGQSTDVDAPPDIIDVDKDDDIIDDEDSLPYDLAYFDDEDLINVDDDDDMSADVVQGHDSDGGGDDRPHSHQAKSTVVCRQVSWSLAALRDQMMESSATQEYPSLIQTFSRHTVGGVFFWDEDRALYIRGDVKAIGSRLQQRDECALHKR